MSTLVNATNVVFFGDVVELEDRYTCGIEQVFKNTALEAFIVQGEPSGSAPYGWAYIDGQFVAKEAPTVLIDSYIAMQIELAKTQYQRDRAAEYPPMTDYIDGIVKGDQAQIQAYIDACLAVKAKYPKP